MDRWRLASAPSLSWAQRTRERTIFSDSLLLTIFLSTQENDNSDRRKKETGRRLASAPSLTRTQRTRERTIFSDSLLLTIFLSTQEISTGLRIYILRLLCTRLNCLFVASSSSNH